MSDERERSDEGLGRPRGSWLPTSDSIAESAIKHPDVQKVLRQAITTLKSVQDWAERNG